MLLRAREKRVMATNFSMQATVMDDGSLIQAASWLATEGRRVEIRLAGSDSHCKLH